jgi:hypothetical protein
LAGFICLLQRGEIMNSNFDFHIYIPTMKRYKKSLTSDFFPKELKSLTTLVVQKNERKKYKKFGLDLMVVPEEITGISKVRQYIIENSVTEKCFMLDDDLKFAKRVEAENKEQVTKYSLKVFSEKEEWFNMFNIVSKKLNKFPMVALLSREGANHYFDSDFSFNVRCLRFLCYRKSVLLKNNIRFDVMPVMEDFFVAIKLLSKGYAVCSVNLYTQGQMIGSNAPGGCSLYRTQALQNKVSAKMTLKFFPNVRLRRKILKSGWKGEFKKTMFDVRIQWKNIFKDGVRKNGFKILKEHKRV